MIFILAVTEDNLIVGRKETEQNKTKKGNKTNAKICIYSISGALSVGGPMLCFENTCGHGI